MKKITGILFHVAMVASVLLTTGPVENIVNQVKQYPLMAGVTVIIISVVTWMSTEDLKWC